MREDLISSHWPQLRGAFRKRWPMLTDSDLAIDQAISATSSACCGIGMNSTASKPGDRSTSSNPSYGFSKKKTAKLK